MSGSASIASVFVQRVVVGVGDMAVSNNTSTILSTYALGSCIGVIAYDPVAQCGGILHLMLPEASISPAKAASQPAMFADTGLPLFFKELVSLHSDPANLRLFVTGGASVIAGTDPFRIGERNTMVTLDYLNKKQYRVPKIDTGGSISRTVHLDLRTGTVNLSTALTKSLLELAA